MALEYELGDIVKTKAGNLAYLQHHYKDYKYGVTFSQNETPWNLIGEPNPHCIGDGVINDVRECEKVDKRAYIEKYGLSLPSKETKEKSDKQLKEIYSSIKIN